MKIAVIGGDGTGPEVTREALKVLKAVSEMDSFSYELTDLDYGSQRYLQTGEILPEGAIELLKQHDAMYLGAVGHPDVTPGVIEKGLLLELRFQLDQYINLRPVKLYPGVETPTRRKNPQGYRLCRRQREYRRSLCRYRRFLEKRYSRRSRHPNGDLFPQGLRTLHPLGL